MNTSTPENWFYANSTSSVGSTTAYSGYIHIPELYTTNTLLIIICATLIVDFIRHIFANKRI